MCGYEDDVDQRKGSNAGKGVCQHKTEIPFWRERPQTRKGQT